MDSADPDTLQHQVGLLRLYGIDSIEEMHELLFNREYNYQRVKTNRDGYVTMNQSQMARSHSFAQLFTLMAREDGILHSDRKVIQFKYQKDELLRGHQQHKHLWLLCSDVAHRVDRNKGYFQMLVEEQEGEYFYKIIQRDVVRTNEQKTPQSHRKLMQILRAVAKRNPFIGYCQGLNFVVNFILIMQFSEQQAFWILVHLLQDLLPQNYYTSMLGVAIDIKLLEVLLQKHKPQLVNQLEAISVNLSMFVLEWLVCLFTTVLPHYLRVTLWDLLFLEGSSILIKCAYLLIEQLEPMIMACLELSDFLVGIQGFKQKIQIQENIFLERLKSVFIDSRLLPLTRRVYERLMISEESDSPKKTRKVACNAKWAVCHQFLNNQKIRQEESPVWVLKQEGPPKLIEDYLDSKLKGHKSTREDSRSWKGRMLIGRISHICDSSSGQVVRGQGIQLAEYDPYTNKYDLPADSPLNQLRVSFFQRTSVLSGTFRLRDGK